MLMLMSKENVDDFNDNKLMNLEQLRIKNYNFLTSFYLRFKRSTRSTKLISSKKWTSIKI